MAPVDRNRRSGRARGPAAPPIPVFPCRPERTLASRPERASREWGAQLAAQRRNPLQGRKKRFGSTAPWRRAGTDAAVTVRADALTPWGGVASSAATASRTITVGPVRLLILSLWKQRDMRGRNLAVRGLKFASTESEGIAG